MHANMWFENRASAVTVPHVGLFINAYLVVLPMKSLAVERRCWGSTRRRTAGDSSRVSACWLWWEDHMQGSGCRALRDRALFLWEKAQLQHVCLFLDCLSPPRSPSALLAAGSMLYLQKQL